VKKTFYLIRHGQTDLNLKGIVQGRGVNTSLNTNGINQANAFFNAYKHVPFDKIYTSTLVRTHQTVAQFVELGIPREDLVGLDEISWGIYEGKVQDEHIMHGFQQLVSAWRNNELDTRIENGESPNQLVTRQKEAVKHMLTKEDEKTILVCMHGRALRILLCHLTDASVSLMDDFPHTNTSMYVLEYENGKFTIIDHYNTAHLEGLECIK
jgi:probable phosphoglycerate mutase